MFRVSLNFLTTHLTCDHLIKVSRKHGVSVPKSRHIAEVVEHLQNHICGTSCSRLAAVFSWPTTSKVHPFGLEAYTIAKLKL